jgi:MFS family permease
LATVSLFHNRWWIVLASFLGLMVSPGPVVTYAFGVFLKPVSEDLGLSRGAFSAALNLNTIILAVFIPVVGNLIDRYGVRIVVMPMIVLFAVTTASQSYLQSSLPVLYGLLALQGLFAACQAPTGYAKAISAWFDRDRGRALGIAMAGVGMGVMLMPQFLTFLMQTYGWRGAYVGLGAVVVVFAFAPVALFVREPVSPGPAAAKERPDLAVGLSVGEAVTCCPRFWSMIVAFFLAIAAINGTLAHVIAMLTDRGVPLGTANLAMSMAGVAIIAGRILSGFFVDRFFAPFVAIFFFTCSLFGILMLLSGAGGAVPILGTALCGFGVGAEVDLMAFFVGRYFGLRAFGAIYGLMFAAFVVGLGLGAYLMGLCFDLAHSYHPMLIMFLGALAVACLLIVGLGPYRFSPAATAPSLAAAAA